MTGTSARALTPLLVAVCVAGLAVVAAVDAKTSLRTSTSDAGSQFSAQGNLQSSALGVAGTGSPAQPVNFLDQLARSAQAMGAALQNFFNSLGNNGNTRRRNDGGGGIIPLVAIDTKMGPTIDIPGILGLNTGASTRGSSPVSVSTHQGTNTKPSTQVNIPGILDLDVGSDSPQPAVLRSLVSVLTGGGQTRVRAPFVDVFTAKGTVSAGPQPSGNVRTNEEQILS